LQNSAAERKSAGRTGCNCRRGGREIGGARRFQSPAREKKRNPAFRVNRVQTFEIDNVVCIWAIAPKGGVIYPSAVAFCCFPCRETQVILHCGTPQRGASLASGAGLADGGQNMGFEIRKIGVIGAGQMGKGIAHVCALSGYDVVLNDISQERIDAGVADVAAQMRRAAERGQLDAAKIEPALARISGAPKIADFADSDIVIEAATEVEEVKRKILADLAKITKSDAIIASNTSSISITRLASVTGRPERFIGIHFMNPVPRMQLVELIRGIATDDATFEDAKAFIAKLGKTASVSEDFPAFIVNRILLPMINEAVYTLYEGVGSVEAIDTAMKLGANHPMGPLQLADFIGLDTCLSVMQVLHEGLADSKYRPCPLLVKYVEAGWLGKKTQRGFYDYRSGTPVPTR
jgi:3-hydroxybutyryl-CoA dehydrogenase